MKKIFTIALAALICAAMFAACEVQQSESSSSLPETEASEPEKVTLPLRPWLSSGSSSSASEISMGIPEPPIPFNKRIFRDFNGKYGLLDKDANVLVEAKYDMAEYFENFFIFSRKHEDGKSWAVVVDYEGKQIGPEIGPGYESTDLAEDGETGKYFAAAVTDGTRKNRIVTKEHEIYIEDGPDRKYWILNAAGERVFDMAFDGYFFLPEFVTNNGADGFWAECDGEFYQYAWNGESYDFLSAKRKGETGEEIFGYKKTVYYWSEYIGDCGYGLNDAEGNVIFEPIYSGIFFPFEDRVLLYSGDYVTGESICRIATLDGEKLAQFGRVGYTVFDDGSYVGIAFANVNAGNIDPDDEITYCYCFVDKDGKILSERFLSLDFRDEGEEHYRYNPESPDDIATAVTESGETVRISIEEYICEP